MVKIKGGDLFIVDNSVEGWKGLRYLEEWSGLANSFDIATGYFEIGSLLALDGRWQQLDEIRILMGDETTYRTRNALLEAVKTKAEQHLNSSIEDDKEQNPFLKGVPAIVDALKSGKIKCRVYNRDKFHAKAYITHAKSAVIGAQALVGSSNFTYPVITASEWEESSSKMFPNLDRYQKEAYWALMKIARQHGGAFLCDGVGLGKTFVGLMLIERLILLDGKRVVLFAPKGTKEGVWEPHLKDWLPHIGGIGGGADFSNLAVFSHTDLNRKGDYPERFKRIAELADGRLLTKKDIDHYQKILVAINETIRIMKKIDEDIEKHGGWPDAFQTN